MILPEGRSGLVQEIGRRLILRGRNQMEIEATQVSGLRQLTQAGQHAVLDPFAKNTTAQQERVDLERFGSGSRDHDAHETIVTETVLDRDGEHISARRGTELLNFGFGITPCSEIELVGPLRELRDARKLLG